MIDGTRNIMLKVVSRRWLLSYTRRPAPLPTTAFISDHSVTGAADDKHEVGTTSLFEPFFSPSNSRTSIFHARGSSSDSIVKKNDTKNIHNILLTMAATRNLNSNIVYDEYNHPRRCPDDPSKQAFAYFILTSRRFVYAALLRLLILQFILNMSASKDVLALASLEVDLSTIEPGTIVTVKWCGEPVFIRRWTKDDIKVANSVDLCSLRDLQEDSERVKNPEWLVCCWGFHPSRLHSLAKCW